MLKVAYASLGSTGPASIRKRKIAGWRRGVLGAYPPPLALPDKGDVQGGRLQQRLAERHAALDARGVARRQALRYPPAKSEPVRLYPGGREEHDRVAVRDVAGDPERFRGNPADRRPGKDDRPRLYHSPQRGRLPRAPHGPCLAAALGEPLDQLLRPV